jgi:hypothetical protein
VASESECKPFEVTLCSQRIFTNHLPVTALIPLGIDWSSDDHFISLSLSLSLFKKKKKKKKDFGSPSMAEGG